MRAALPNYVMLLIFFTLIACFSWLSPDRFATLGNFRSLLSQNALLALAGLAVMVPLITDEFDLSVAAVVGLANVDRVPEGTAKVVDVDFRAHYQSIWGP